METLLQIVGFGPAALGLFIAADRNGRLQALLDGGVQVHERSASFSQWACLAYAIEANSPIADFLRGIRSNGVFAQCLRQPRVQRWLQNPEQVVSLVEVSAFLRQLAQVILDLCRDQPNAAIHFAHPVASVRSAASGFSVQGDWGSSHSRYLVLACGARVRDLQPQEGAAPTASLSCDRVLRGQADPLLLQALEQGRQLLVLGGSHSAFSVVGYLLERFAGRLPTGAIQVLCRQRPALWAASAGVAPPLQAQDLIDEESGEVNRFCGLRGAARDTLLQIEAGTRACVELHIGSADPRPWLSRGALLINATGYRPRVPGLLNAAGVSLTLDQRDGNLCKHPRTHELMVGGQALPGLFGTGLGYADRRGDTLEVGVNFFHGRCAGNILHAVL
ncbi:hypothetical protein ACMGG8_16875 [Pseudomonas sp. BNK-45]|uniref:hypothetical protein n=1 Tax=Pseudomonas sp. BNK-45 TaxID=3376180 RepID=UPI0039BFCD2B